MPTRRTRRAASKRRGHPGRRFSRKARAGSQKRAQDLRVKEFLGQVTGRL